MKELQIRCKELIEKYQNEPKKLEKLSIISEILKEEKAFFKIDIDTALSILQDLEFDSNEIMTIYSDLISAKNFISSSEDID